MLDTTTKRKPGRQPGVGAGPNGEVRNVLTAYKAAPTEQEAINALLKSHGHPTNGAGVRAFLLKLAAERTAA